MSCGPIGDGNGTTSGCLTGCLLAVGSVLLLIGLLVLTARAVT